MPRKLTLLTVLLIAALFAFLSPGRAVAQELRVFRSQQPFEADLMRRQLYDYLTRIAFDYLDEHEAEIDAVLTRADIEERKKVARERIMDAIGPFPERTDMKAVVTGAFERSGYRVEKILLQSRPGLYVTGLLYIPTSGRGPFPAVLGTCGHTDNGKAADVYQRIWISLALKGYVVFAFDPPGQGERFDYYDTALGESIVRGTVIEHTMAGIQCILTGSNAANYFIWDEIRSLDYLLSRPEVDPKRVAVTGNSGGGVQSAYLGALDDRLAACVPSCYMTSWRRLWTTLGPQDAEQNMIPFVGGKLDFVDYIIPFAPKPYLMNTAIQDFFSIIGARETYSSARRLYGIMGAEDMLRMFEADDVHGYSKPRREAMYGFLNEHFLGGPRGSDPEPEFDVELDRTLQVTPTGQVITSYKDARTVGQVNAEFGRKVRPRVSVPTDVNALERFRTELLEKVRSLIAFERHSSPLDIQHRGSAVRPGMKIEMLTYESEPGMVIPALLFSPAEPTAGATAVIYAADRGKADDADTEIAELVKAGHVVLAPDVRGKGELSRGEMSRGDFATWFSSDWQLAMMALQVKKPLVGLRAIDLVRAVDVLAARENTSGLRVAAVGRGSGCVPLLHAAALDNRIQALVLDGGLYSWEALLEAHLHRHQLDNVVHDAYRHYDLPLLAASMAPRSLVLTGMTTPMGHAADPEAVTRSYAMARACFELTGNPRFPIVTERPVGISIAALYGQVLGQ